MLADVIAQTSFCNALRSSRLIQLEIERSIFLSLRVRAIFQRVHGTNGFCDLAAKALPFGALFGHAKFKGYHNGIGNWQCNRKGL